jgi:hypothetical protein
MTCGKGNFYYEAQTVSVDTNGKYHFSSKSDIDTYGYIYINSFDPSNPRRNLLDENNDSGEKKQFKLKIHLQSRAKYILVTTTNSPGVIGSFLIIASGPKSVNFTSTTIPWTTSNIKTTKRTSKNLNYSTVFM